MNCDNTKRAYSHNEFINLDFDISDYEFNDEPGTFDGTLIVKKWGRKKNVIAYVDLDDGRKIICVAYQNNDYLGLPDMAMGAKVRLTYIIGVRSGKVRLTAVECIG